MLLTDDENEVFTPSTHPRRRPTINRKRKTSEVAEEHTDSGARYDVKKKEPVVGDVGENICSYVVLG